MNPKAKDVQNKMHYPQLWKSLQETKIYGQQMIHRWYKRKFGEM